MNFQRYWKICNMRKTSLTYESHCCVRGFEELVFLYRVLPSELTRGYERVNSIIIDKVNGRHFKNFKEFVKLVDSQKSRFIVFEDEYNYKIALDKEEVKKRQSQILGRYNIKSDRSDDLK